MTTSKNLTITHIIPEKRQTGEITFAVVDKDKRAAVAFYPASQLNDGINSTHEQILERFHSDCKPQATPV